MMVSYSLCLQIALHVLLQSVRFNCELTVDRDKIEARVIGFLDNLTENRKKPAAPSSSGGSGLEPRQMQISNKECIPRTFGENFPPYTRKMSTKADADYLNSSFS